MQRHRIFIAINFPENIKKKLADYQKKIEELFTLHQKLRFGAGPVRWTKVNSLHITLIFLGYITDEELLETCKITKEVAKKYSSFFVNLNEICYGPVDKKPPRMVWVLGEKSQEFSDLKDDLEKSLLDSEKINFSPENRKFSPHITLGRIKQWEWRRIEPEERPEIKEEINLNFPVDSIEIMESELKRTGPEYTILESYSLGSEI